MQDKFLVECGQIFSVSYRAPRGATLAVFVSGLRVAQHRGRHKAVIHRTATSKHHCSPDLQLYFPTTNNQEDGAEDEAATEAGSVAGGVDAEKGNAADSADEDGVAADGVDGQGVGELEGCAAELLCVVDVAAGAGLGESNDLRDPCSAVPDVDLGDADEGADIVAGGVGGTDGAAVSVGGTDVAASDTPRPGQAGGANAERDIQALAC